MRFVLKERSKHGEERKNSSMLLCDLVSGVNVNGTRNWSGPNHIKSAALGAIVQILSSMDLKSSRQLFSLVIMHQGM